jgi:hypothetical protein
MRSGYVMLRNAAGPGVKVRLQAAQRHSWTISSFLRRVPRRVRFRPPQYGLGLWLLTCERDASDAWNWRRHARLGYGHGSMHLTEIEW